jgi:uncharacterized repeat protein (TIGR03803 family)
MTRVNGLKVGFAVLTLCAVTAIASPAQIFTTLVNFDPTDGGGPLFMSLVQGEDGNFYGTTACCGANGYGTVFMVTPGGTLSTLYDFCAQANCIDGATPEAGLVLATDGNFYGTTASGGASGWGTAFRISPSGAFATLYSFCAEVNCVDGAVPYAGLTQATDGNFYGTTTQGGSTGSGTLFRITAVGELRTLHSFCSKLRCADGAHPQGTLIQGTDGSLYGTTYTDAYLTGTIFKMTPSGMMTFLDLPRIDAWLEAGLVQGTDGNFYFPTYNGGHEGDGSVLRGTPEGTLATLHQFCSGGNCSDGAFIAAGLAQATDANFYGAASRGGDVTCNAPNGGCGTLFQITPAGAFAVLHTFESFDGYEPLGGLLQATSGVIYGTTAAGGINDAGTIFSLDMGLGPFIAFVQPAGKVAASAEVLGQGFTGTTAVSFNGTPANFTVVADTYLTAAVPTGATTGYVTVTTPTGVLTSNVPFRVIQ